MNGFENFILVFVINFRKKTIMFLRSPFLAKRVAPMALRRPTLIQPTSMIGSPLFFANMGLLRQFNATTLNIDSVEPRSVGPVPIKINVGQQLSQMDLLQE